MRKCELKSVKVCRFSEKIKRVFLKIWLKKLIVVAAISSAGLIHV